MQGAAADAIPTLSPIVVEIVVPCPPDRAFDYFTHDIGRWWPLASHSLGGNEALDVRFEPHDGRFRLVETLRDGRKCTWGTVIAWAPGDRVAFSWHLDRDPSTAQHVDVVFAPVPEGTRVTLTHSGWERRADGAAARENYGGGWSFVLGQRFRGFCMGTNSANPAHAGELRC